MDSLPFVTFLKFSNQERRRQLSKKKTRMQVREAVIIIRWTGFEGRSLFFELSIALNNELKNASKEDPDKITHEIAIIILREKMDCSKLFSTTITFFSLGGE